MTVSPSRTNAISSSSLGRAVSLPEAQSVKTRSRVMPSLPGGGVLIGCADPDLADVHFFRLRDRPLSGRTLWRLDMRQETPHRTLF